MATLNIGTAKARFSGPVRRAEAGEDIVIARGDRRAVRLVPYAAKAEKSKEFGSMKGLIEVGPEFFDSLPDEELEAWYR